MEIAIFKVGDTVRIKGGEDGRIVDIQRPLGYMRCRIKTVSGSEVIRQKHELIRVHGALNSHNTPGPLSASFLPPEVVSELMRDDYFDPPPAIEKKRKFHEVKDEDIDTFISSHENKNTAKKTRSDMSILHQFLQTNVPDTPLQIEKIEPTGLSKILSKFFISVRRQDETEYEPSTMRVFLQSFSRYLRQKNYPHDIYMHAAFSQLRQTLTAKQKDLKAKGKGNAPNKSCSLSTDEIDKLYQNGLIGTHHPEAIINGLWWANTTHFGLRGTTAHHNMRWGDVALQTDALGNDFLSFNERTTKTRTGADVKDFRQVRPCAWATPENTKRCPVQLYKAYASRRPLDFCKDDDPFYISTTTVQNPKPTDTWFKRQPIGKNKIGGILKNMAGKCGLDKAKKITNHSARKTMIQNLVASDVPPTHIMQISGHRNMQSLNTYSSITQNQHREISHMISGAPCSKPATVTHSQDNTNSTDRLALPTMPGTDTVTETYMKSIFAGPVSNCSITVNLNSHKNAETTHSVNVSQQNNLA